jgi:hypothetical protein
MRHQLHPTVDGLENKTLLSNLGVGLIAPHPVLQAEVQRVAPIRVAVDHHLASRSVLRADVHAADTTQSWMTLSLTTNQSTYYPGQLCTMSLTIKNTSTHDGTIGIGPSIDGFIVTQNGNMYWRSNAGVEPPYIVVQTIKPGQSITLTADWTVPATANGTYVVHNQLFPTGPTATFNVTTPGN